MTKFTKLLLVMVFILLLSVSVNAYFRNQYWECTSLGEASLGDAAGRRIGDICDVTCCKLCVSDDPFIDCLSGSAQPICECSAGNGSGTLDVTPPEITFISPVDGATYNTDDIELIVESNEFVAEFKRAFDLSSLRNWCTSTDRCEMTERRLGEGEHTVRVQARDPAGNINEREISFIVDTEAPEINRVNPGNNAFVKAGGNDFTVFYTESSVESVKLYYKKDSDSNYQSLSFDDCPNGEEVTCTAALNLNSYSQGQVLNMYAEVSDLVNTATSSIFSVTIDDNKAELPFSINSPEENGLYDDRRVDFSITSFIPDASFSYSKNGGDSFSTICSSNCDDFDKSISLSDGDNEIIVRLTDEFDNVYEQTVNLFIDSRSPSSVKLEPRGGRDPIGGEPFVVEYTEEEQVTDVILHYEDESGTNHEVVRSDCPTGRRVSCEFDIDLSPVDGQIISYFAEVRDRASSTTTRVEEALVDTTDPILTAGDLDAVQGKKITFDLAVSESVTLEYIDNGGRVSSLCRGCDSYDRSKSFKDGDHVVEVIARDDAGNIDTHTYEFLVDSRGPRAGRLDMEDSTNGVIPFEFTEANPVEVVLYYRVVDTEEWMEKSFDHCEGDPKETLCELGVDLDAFEGQELEFFATVEDITGEIDDSRVEESVVDVTAPAFTLAAPAEGDTFDRSLPIAMATDEDVTFEYSDNGGEFKRLCSRCDDYDRSKTMGGGEHTVVFRVYDEAGNSVEAVRTVTGGIS